MKITKMRSILLAGALSVAVLPSVAAQQAHAVDTLEVWSLQQSEGPLKEAQAKAVRR